MAQSDNHPDPKTRKDQQYREWLLLPYPFPPYSTWLTSETLDIHCTVDIAADFSIKKPTHRTVFVVLDLTAAFDNEDHKKLLDYFYNANIPATIRRWINNHMQNRRAEVHFRQQESKGENWSGTKLSSVSSALQLLFGRLSNTTFHQQADHVPRWNYHLHIRTSGGWPNQWPQHLSAQVHNYINEKKLTVSAASSTVTFFTPDSHEHQIHLEVKLADQIQSQEKKPKVLGLTVDIQLTFTQHCNISQLRAATQ